MSDAALEPRWWRPDRRWPGGGSREAPPRPNHKLPGNSPAKTAGTAGFASAAPDLRRRGLFPIPIADKTPLISRFTKMRRPSLATIERLAKRFPDAGVGIVTGRGFIVVDVDSADPEILRAVEARFGPTPLKVATPSGGQHWFYRSSGERDRNLRTEGLPVDVKGLGGFVAAPPTVRQVGPNAGKAYRFETGSWDDLPRLPRIKAGALDPPLSRPDSPRELHLKVVVRGAGSANQLAGFDVGIRNDTLWRVAMRLARNCHSEAELFAAVSERNAFQPPLEPAEVAKISASAWRYEIRGENRIGRRTHRASPYTILAATHPDAEWLLRLFRHAHGARVERGETFAARPRAMAQACIIPEWGASYRRYERAIRVLVELGYLILVHRGGRRRGDCHRYRFRKIGDAPMPPRLIVSNPKPAGIDLMRVVEATRSGQSVREAAQSLSMSKSQVGRLRQQAVANGMLDAPDPTLRSAPNMLPQQRRVLASEVSQTVPTSEPNERKKTPPAAPPPPFVCGTLPVLEEALMPGQSSLGLPEEEGRDGEKNVATGHEKSATGSVGTKIISEPGSFSPSVKIAATATAAQSSVRQANDDLLPEAYIAGLSPDDIPLPPKNPPPAEIKMPPPKIPSASAMGGGCLVVVMVDGQYRQCGAPTTASWIPFCREHRIGTAFIERRRPLLHPLGSARCTARHSKSESCSLIVAVV